MKCPREICLGLPLFAAYVAFFVFCYFFGRGVKRWVGRSRLFTRQASKPIMINTRLEVCCDFLAATSVITRKVIRSFQSLAVMDRRTHTHTHRYTGARSLFIRKRIRKPLTKS